MQITLKWLIDHAACSEGRGWFDQKFPDGGELPAVLEALEMECQTKPGLGYTYGWPCWLMEVVSASAFRAAARQLGVVNPPHKVSWGAVKWWCLGSPEFTDADSVTQARLHTVIQAFLGELAKHEDVNSQ